MVQTVLVLVILTIGGLWYTGRVMPAGHLPGTGKQAARRAGELLQPKVYGALLVLTLILVLLWK